MNKEVIRDGTGRCHSCGEKRIPEQLTRWKCNCKNKKPILTVGMDYSNWDKGFIERYNKETEEGDMTEEERDIADGITEKSRENPRLDCFPKEVKKKKQKQHEQKN